MTGIEASLKEKDLSRLIYRICGSGLFSLRQSRMRRNFCTIFSTKQLPGNRIQVMGKGHYFLNVTCKTGRD